MCYCTLFTYNGLHVRAALQFDLSISIGNFLSYLRSTSVHPLAFRIVIQHAYNTACKQCKRPAVDASQHSTNGKLQIGAKHLSENLPVGMYSPSVSLKKAKHIVPLGMNAMNFIFIPNLYTIQTVRFGVCDHQRKWRVWNRRPIILAL